MYERYGAITSLLLCEPNLAQNPNIVRTKSQAIKMIHPKVYLQNVQEVMHDQPNCQSLQFPWYPAKHLCRGRIFCSHSRASWQRELPSTEKYKMMKSM